MARRPGLHTLLASSCQAACWDWPGAWPPPSLCSHPAPRCPCSGLSGSRSGKASSGARVVSLMGGDALLGRPFLLPHYAKMASLKGGAVPYNKGPAGSGSRSHVLGTLLLSWEVRQSRSQKRPGDLSCTGATPCRAATSGRRGSLPRGCDWGLGFSVHLPSRLDPDHRSFSTWLKPNEPIHRVALAGQSE